MRYGFSYKTLPRGVSTMRLIILRLAIAMRYGLVTRRPTGRLYIKKRTALLGSPLLVYDG